MKKNFFANYKKMNKYIDYEILQYLNSVDDKNFCISKKLLSVYQVDYTDPTNSWF